MGNVCTSNPKYNGKESFEESQAPEEPEEAVWNDENGFNIKLLKDMQDHNLKRLKDEIETDIHSFILNNLLMCIQFFDNFEKSKEAANQFKRTKESEINEKLAKEPLDRGTILGERRCHLVHGMGHILTKNFIYRPPDNMNEGEYYGSQYYGVDSRNTFICEGILPLEFFMTWDNLELYQSSEWDSLQAMQYSAAKGSPPILRFCMEEPDKTNKVPRGYLRLRCIDVTATIYKSGTDSSYDYAYGSRFSDIAVEARSDSEEGRSVELSDASGSDMDDDFVRNVNIKGLSSSFLRKSEEKSQNERPKVTPLQPEEVNEKLKHLLNPESAHKTVAETILNRNGRRLSGIMPQHYPQLLASKLSLGVNKSESIIPSVKVNLSYTPPVTSHLTPPFSFQQSPKNSLIPPHASGKFNRHSISMHGLTGSSGTSGYDTSYGMSRSSSLASEDIRFKWRQLELKQLSHYPIRNRVKPDIEVEKQEPLSNNCFIPVKSEILSDSENDSDSDSSSTYSSSNDSDRFAETNYQDRYYLNSTQFSSEYCSEFTYVGMKQGLSPDTISRAVILGTTIRCAVPYHIDPVYDDEYNMVYTFTPSLRSKYWPPNYYFWFNQRMFNKKFTPGSGDTWPTQDQVESIEKLGAYAIPIGFRSLEFFNTHQSLEWQLNFPQAETLLLNSLKHVHWRAYIFSSLIFRAFLAPLGPQGIGVEHLRNIIYFMCHEDFVGWNEEQPGLHLRAVLSKLYDCLGKGKMPNFFVQSQDLLKSVPPQNSRLIQAHLSHLRDNLIVYCIYAFRNLTCLQENLFPIPDLKVLYEIITVPGEQELLGIVNPLLRMRVPEFEAKPQHKNKQKKKTLKPGLDLISNEAMIEKDFISMTKSVADKPDKVKSKYHKKHKEYERSQREQKDIDRERLRHNGPPDAKIPSQERRKSIDLKKLPVIKEKFSTRRKVLLVDFFVKQFLVMAKRCNEFRSYSQSSMYIMQVENLCEILLDPTIDLGMTNVDRNKIEDYQSECVLLRQIVGKEMHEYVLSRFSHLNLPSLTSNNIIGELNKKRGPFQSNWDFRKLPTPPGSHLDEKEFSERMNGQVASSSGLKRTSVTKRLETPNISKSLQSFNSILSEASDEKSPVRRQESIKFVDKPVQIKRTASKQSIVLMNAENQFDSTDL